MQAQQHILVIRFSSMGDVAMAVPVIRNVLAQNPSFRVTVVSNAFFEPLFNGMDRCTFYPAFLKQQHKGVPGIFRLYKQLKKLARYDAVIDLHGVLRSYLLSSLFRFAGCNRVVIDKGRIEKKTLTRKENKVCKQLTSTHERYAEVFRKAGLTVRLNTSDPVYKKVPVPAALSDIFSAGKKIIGIAPFARYPEKMFPVSRMKILVQQLATENNIVLLFGGGKKESILLQEWEREYDSVVNIAGKFSLRDELAIVSNLDCMLSMDSANMHFASLFNVPVVSVWGATHPFAGFYGWAQDEKNIVQINLYCRPCSVFGNKPCYRGDHACMNNISEESILDRVKGVIGG